MQNELKKCEKRETLQEGTPATSLTRVTIQTNFHRRRTGKVETPG